MEFLTVFIIAIILGCVNFEIRTGLEKWMGHKMSFPMWAVFTAVILYFEITTLTYLGILK